MKPAGRLPALGRLAAPEIGALVRAFRAKGGVVRFVGGCVRDGLLGRAIGDIDLATPETPETVLSLLSRAQIKAIPTGLEHGTITAVIGSEHFEITTLRHDVETFGRRARVAYTDDWDADASRRDFTINALYADPDGTFYDPFGGAEDLRHGRVRFVGTAEERIREDVLRLLRFFRFHAHYGQGAPDPDGLAACRRLAHLLPGLSGERVAGEVLKILSAPDAPAIVAAMAEADILVHILPEARAFGRLNALTAVEGFGLGVDPVRRLAALIEGGPAAAEAVATRLRLSNDQRARLVGIAETAPPIHAGLDARQARGILYRIGRERFRDRVVQAWADSIARAPAADEAGAWRALLAHADAWQKVELPVKGRDVVALGIARGPAVGHILGALEAWWAEGDFRAGREEALVRLRALVDDFRREGAG